MMNGHQYFAIDKENNLVGIISSNLKSIHHCREVVKTAINWLVSSDAPSKFNQKKLCKNFIIHWYDPVPITVCSFGSNCIIKKTLKWERVQQRIAKNIPRLRNVPFVGRLKRTKLIQLIEMEDARRSDKSVWIFKGFDNNNAEDYFPVDHSNITRRRNYFKIIG